MVDVVPDRDRLRAFSLNYWAINLGFALAAILAGLAAEADYLLLFVVDAATTLVTAVISCSSRCRDPAGRAPPAHRVGAARAGAVGTVLRDRVFVALRAAEPRSSALVFLQHISTLPIAMGDDGPVPGHLRLGDRGQRRADRAGPAVHPPADPGPRPARACWRWRPLIIGVGFGLTAFAGAAAWFYAITVLIWTLGEMLKSPSNATTGRGAVARRTCAGATRACSRCPGRWPRRGAGAGRRRTGAPGQHGALARRGRVGVRRGGRPPDLRPGPRAPGGRVAPAGHAGSRLRPLPPRPPGTISDSLAPTASTS